MNEEQSSRGVLHWYGERICDAESRKEAKWGSPTKQKTAHRTSANTVVVLGDFPVSGACGVSL